MENIENRVLDLENKATEIRKLIIEMIGKLGIGHIGGCLSIADVLSVLYFDAMNVNPNDSKMETRDRFILSKGHGGPAVYAALALKGFFDKSELDTLNRSNTNLPSHCDMNLTNGIDMTAGSLGQGFSAAIGIAIGAKLKNNPCYVYTIVGDGESQEGQIWEAAMLAGSRKLDNVIAFVDYNNMQIDGYVSDVNGLDPLDDKWKAFGWDVQVVDGHDIEKMLEAIDNAKAAKGKPSMIILNTIKGKGAYFAEGKLGSHNMPIREDEMKIALSQLENG